LTFRKDVDEALQSRGFLIPTCKVKGDSGYEFLLNNFWPHLGNLSERLDEWGKVATHAIPASNLEAIARSPEFRSKAKTVLKELGANRAAEIVTVALLVGEVAGIDILEDLREANAVREIASEASASQDQEELLEVLADLTRTEIASKKEELFGEVKIVRVRQKDAFDEFNRRRRERGEKPLGTKSFVSVRREAGIGEAWMRNYHGAYVWGLPVDWVRTNLTRESESPMVTPEPNPETLAPSVPTAPVFFPDPATIRDEDKVFGGKNFADVFGHIRNRVRWDSARPDLWIARDTMRACLLPENAEGAALALVQIVRSMEK